MVQNATLATWTNRFTNIPAMINQINMELENHSLQQRKVKVIARLPKRHIQETNVVHAQDVGIVKA